MAKPLLPDALGSESNHCCRENVPNRRVADRRFPIARRSQGFSSC